MILSTLTIRGLLLRSPPTLIWVLLKSGRWLQINKYIKNQHRGWKFFAPYYSWRQIFDISWLFSRRSLSFPAGKSFPSNQRDSCSGKLSCYPRQPKVDLPHTQYTESLTKIILLFTFELIPIRSEGRDSVINFFSIETASVIIYCILSVVSLFSSRV